MDGCKGIVEYNDTLIRLHIPEGQLKVSGRELQIACMSEDSLIVRGFLSGLNIVIEVKSMSLVSLLRFALRDSPFYGKGAFAERF